MKKMLISAALFVVALTQVNAQDKIKKHSGETLDVKVIKVSEFAITFKYPGEDAEQTIGKLAVADITYGSGRKEAISDKVVVSGEDDWEKVQIITDKNQLVGLKKGTEVSGKTSGFINYNSAASSDKKATKKIKQAAAEKMAPFIFMEADKADGYGLKQSFKNGVTYSYR